MRPSSHLTSSWFIAFGVCSTVSLLLMLVDADRYAHWFLVPLVAAGTLIGTDAVDWFRGKLGLFDPVGIIGVLGFHHFFVAPLLHMHWQYWLKYVTTWPEDWRPWLGWMALLNALGLVLYRVARQVRFGRRETAPRAIWRFNEHRAVFGLFPWLVLSLALQGWVLFMSGGISGYVEKFVHLRSLAFSGFGTIFMFSELFPILFILAYCVYSRRSPALRQPPVVIVFLAATFLLKFLVFGGLRGSRSETVWLLFWATGAVHLLVRPISRKAIGIGVAVLVLFMYLYGFYKSGVPLDRFDELQDSKSRQVVETQTGRSLKSVLLLDLARADIQAFELYKIEATSQPAPLAYGATYLRSLMIIVPRQIWANRPPTKQIHTTEILMYPGAYVPNHRASSYVCGLAGEALLNFGAVGVPFAFVAFGLGMGVCTRFGRRLLPGDARWYLYPWLVNLAFIGLLGDMDNLLFTACKNGLVPVIALWMCCDKIPLSRQEES